MTFRLHANDACTSQVGGDIVIPGVPVADGLFSVALDVAHDDLNGQGLWLEVEVGGTAVVCQEILPVPYALSLRPGASIHNTASEGTSVALVVENDNGLGLRVLHAGSVGVHVDSAGSSGVFVEHAGADGVTVEQADDHGLSVIDAGGDGVFVFMANGYGVNAQGSAGGVQGHAYSTTGEVHGVFGQTDSSTNGASGVHGYASATGGQTYGVAGGSNSTSGRGVYGQAGASSGTNFGVYGETASTAGRGVYGIATAASGQTFGVVGKINSSTDGAGGVYGSATATSGATYGIYGLNASTSGRGVTGHATATSGTNYGVLGRSNSTSGRGVYGTADATSGVTYGVYGKTNSVDEDACGVYGEASDDNADSDTKYGVYGVSQGGWGTGVYGYATFNEELVTRGPVGVRGKTDGLGGIGVYGYSSGEQDVVGVYGIVDCSAHPYNCYAGRFIGDVSSSGSMYLSGGSFLIDHPLDPANKYLYHSFVESPDMMNVYNGNVVLGEDGQAWVDLPDYFEALNRDFRYQLTCIGGFAPVYVAHEIQDNRFLIAGGEPGLKVSWQVTGVRQDPWANANRFPTEKEKPADEQGYYLHPEVYGQPKSMGVEATRDLQQ
jgi:hypothetical protein